MGTAPREVLGSHLGDGLRDDRLDVVPLQIRVDSLAVHLCLGAENATNKRGQEDDSTPQRRGWGDLRTPKVLRPIYKNIRREFLWKKSRRLPLWQERTGACRL